MYTSSARHLFSAPLVALVLVAVLIGLSGCGSGTDQSQTGAQAGEPQELTVSAASSLKAAFTDIAAAFDEANNCRTSLNFDSSGSLQKQIEAGAPVDVFASASPKQVDNLLQRNLVDQASVATFARNEILLAVPADSGLAISSFEDLTKAEVKRIAYGDPASVPHGTYAEEMLTTLGILDQVKSKVVYTKNVSQTLTYIASGEVDAGIMFATDAVAGGDKVKVVATSEPSGTVRSHTPSPSSQRARRGILLRSSWTSS